MACRVTGSANVCCHLLSPAQAGSPSPSHSMKDSTTTPASGIRANAPKNTRAGRTMRKGGPPERPAVRVPPFLVPGCGARPTVVCGSGASVELDMSERGIHVVDELLRGDLAEEQLAEVVQQFLGLPGREGLVPRELEVRGLLGESVGIGEEVRVLALAELVLDALHRRDRAGGDHVLDLGVVVELVADPPECGLLSALGRGGGDREDVGRVADDVR